MGVADRAHGFTTLRTKGNGSGMVDTFFPCVIVVWTHLRQICSTTDRTGVGRVNQETVRAHKCVFHNWKLWN